MGNINISGNVSGSGNVFGDNAQVTQMMGDKPGGAGPERDGSTSPAPGRPDGYSDPGQGAMSEDTRRLSKDEVVEFARVYSSRDRATTLLRRAGFHMASLPAFDASPSPYAYWNEVSEQIGHGLVARGRQRLLAVARSDYPANPVFLGRGQRDLD
jgi:hypothetical protein